MNTSAAAAEFFFTYTVLAVVRNASITEENITVTCIVILPPEVQVQAWAAVPAA